MIKPAANLVSPLLNAGFSGDYKGTATTPAVRSAPPISILGVPLDSLTMTQALARFDEMIASGKPHFVATANVDFLIQARTDVELRRILLDAHMVLCDGTPLVWVSKFLGNPLPERVAGADLVPLFIERAAKKNYRLYFLGGSMESNRQAVANLRARFPNLNIVGHQSPAFKPLLEMDHEQIAREIAEAKPDVLMVSFGCPKAEKWMAMHFQKLGVPVTIGVGATIDFLAGHMRRAPKWMQNCGLEWTFRLLQEPRRLFMRYANDVVLFGWELMGQAWHSWVPFSNGRSTRNEWRVVKGSGWQRVIPGRHLDRETILRDWDEWETIFSGDRHCLLDLAEVGSVDSTGIALLCRLHQRMRANGCQLVILSAQPRVRAILKWAGIDDFFYITRDALETRSLLEKARLGPCTVSVNPQNGCISWNGEVTAMNSAAVGEKTKALFPADPAQAIRIDLSWLRFIDSSGAALMLGIFQNARKEDRRVEFLKPTAAVRNVLKLARLSSLVSEKDTIKSL